MDVFKAFPMINYKSECLMYSFTSENNLPSRKVMEKLGMTFLDNFEYPNLSKYHPLKRHVRYYKELLPS